MDTSLSGAGTTGAAAAGSLFDGPKVKGITLDTSLLETSFLTAIGEDGSLGDAHRGGLVPARLLAGVRLEGPVELPLPLCEFLAYKAALAYEAPAVIRQDAGAVGHLTLLDSAKSTEVADTQGFLFVLDGIAYVVLRGTEPKVARDRRSDLDDRLTDSLAGQDEAAVIKSLARQHGSGIGQVIAQVKAVPGRHLGFAIAWAAVHDEVMAFLDGPARGLPVVITGHSLGGALAQIGGFEIASRGRHVAAVVTFGAPLVGNTDYMARYEAALAGRTIRLESDGDSVPKIMRRWYYRLGRDLQQVVRAMLFQSMRPRQQTHFAFSEGAWVFDKEPLLSASEAEEVVRSIKEAAERLAREEAERVERERKEREKREAERQKAAAERKEAGQGPKDVAADAKPASAETSKPGEAKGDIRVFLLIFGSIATVVLLICAYCFVRKKLASHAMMNRYALYLSTLSYQQIRAVHARRSQSNEAVLEAANADLARYLRFIRGPGPLPAGGFYAPIAELPVRVPPKLDFATFASRNESII